MKASALLTAVALLVGAAGAELDVNLNIVFDEIAKLNVSSQVRAADPPAVHAVSRQPLNAVGLFQNFFVEDVRHLAEGVNGCRVRGAFLFISNGLERLGPVSVLEAGPTVADLCPHAQAAEEGTFLSD